METALSRGAVVQRPFEETALCRGAVGNRPLQRSCWKTPLGREADGNCPLQRSCWKPPSLEELLTRGACERHPQRCPLRAPPWRAPPPPKAPLASATRRLTFLTLAPPPEEAPVLLKLNTGMEQKRPKASKMKNGLSTLG